MKLVHLAAALGSAAIAMAQTTTSCSSAVAAIPTCGVACITSAASAVGCAATDFGCQCSSSQSSAIEASALNCVLGGCGLVTALQVLSAANAICTACA